MPTAYKLFTNIIKNRLNGHVEEEMVEEECGFMKGRSCTDAIFTVQQIIEKRKEDNFPLFLSFIDYEQAASVLMYIILILMSSYISYDS